MVSRSQWEALLRRGVAVVATASLWVSVGVLTAAATSSRVEQSPASATQPSHVEAADSRVTPAFFDQPGRIRTCVISQLPEVSEKKRFTAAVVSQDSGEVLWESAADEQVAPASVTKLFTAVAALKVLGADYRMRTTVVDGGNGQLWLVGGGDPTITRAPGRSYYGATHSLDDLADQVVSAFGTQTPITLSLDNSRYQAFNPWDSTWRTNAWALGYVAPVTSIQVDGDRDDPALRLGRRSSDPAARALGWFAEALGARINSSVVSAGKSAAPDGPVVAEVYSAPLSNLVQVMLLDSDNTIAEVLGREVALALGSPSIDEAFTEVFASYDLGNSDSYFQDASGLSPLTQVSAHTVVSLLELIEHDEQLGRIIGYMPVAGETGSLQRRFIVAGVEAAGQVAAKTGSIRGVRSLAGVVDAGERGSVFFSANLSGTQVDDSSRKDIDAWVAEIYRCGENLADWSPDQAMTSLTGE
jgi:D-alanyl-D-alanine carboxypeptidase/D-alanyl-D-alanine-endopeptidase (penicillin-binding protein 4)